MTDLKNKIIVITGGLGQIGKALACELALSNSKIIILDIQNKNKLKNIKNYHVIKNNIFYFKCDVSNKKSVKNVSKKILKKFKKIHILINNAAQNDAVEKKKNLNNSKFENLSLKDWQKTILVNLNSMFLCSQIFGRELIKNKNSIIINISSIYGMVGPNPNIYKHKNKKVFHKNPAYLTSKAGVLNFTRFLASYWGEKGMRVNCISPGGIENRQNKNFIKKYKNNTLLGRMGKTDDIVGVVKFLCSKDSKYITGSNLVVDGGWTAI